VSGTLNGNISFDEIPNDWPLPGAYMEIRPSYRNMGLTGYPARVLILGHKLTAGSAVALTAYNITRDDQAGALFGVGSMLEGMVKAFRRANPFVTLDAMAVAEPAGAAATHTITISGAAVANNILQILVGGRRVAVPVRPSDTPTVVAAAVVAAVAAEPSLRLVTAASTAGVVTLTLANIGAFGSDLDVRATRRTGETIPPGLGVVIAAGAAGTGNPSLTPVFAAVATQWYTGMVVPWSDATTLTALAAELDRRYGAMVRLDCHAYLGLRATQAAAITLGAGQNARQWSFLPASRMPTPPWEVAALLAGVGERYLTDDPARQLRGLALPGCIPPAVADRYTDTERADLLRNGMSTFEVLPDDTVVLERVVTGYRVSNLGVADTAYRDIMRPKLLSRIRYDWNAYVKLLYPRHKLADDGSPGAEYGEDVVTPRRLQAAWAGRCNLYQRIGWIENASAMAAQAVFLRDTTDRNRVNYRAPVDPIDNLMVLAGALEFEV
jgi:phage tail sheath gpL-like